MTPNTDNAVKTLLTGPEAAVRSVCVPNIRRIHGHHFCTS